MKKICIVGAGIAGLFSAKLLAQKGMKVTLIESAPDVGGLLKSFRSSLGQDFDYGTHIMRETGVAGVDELLFKNLDAPWRSFAILKTGSVVHGQLYTQSAFMNANSLPQQQYDPAMNEFLTLPRPSQQPTSLKDHLNNNFGPLLNEALFRPALEKFFGSSQPELHVSALKQFGMTRIVAFDAAKTRELKKSDWYDSRLAFHSYEEGVGNLLNFYPKEGGIGLFVENLKKDLLSLGVDIRCQERLEKMNIDNGRVERVQTSTSSFDCDQLVWTLPIPMLNKLCQPPNPKAAAPLSFRDVALFYFTFDKAFLSDLYYIMNFDPLFRSFRITLYSNLKQNDHEHYSCCVEVLGQKDDLQALPSDQILRELQDLGLVAKTANLVDSQQVYIPYAFPLLTNDFVASSCQSYEKAQGFYKNVSFIGKSSGKVFFTNDVLIDAYQQLQAL